MRDLLEKKEESIQKQTQIQEKTLQTQEAILLHQTSPKKVHVGAVQKNADGRITGATISSTVQ